MESVSIGMYDQMYKIATNAVRRNAPADFSVIVEIMDFDAVLPRLRDDKSTLGRIAIPHWVGGQFGIRGQYQKYLL